MKKSVFWLVILTILLFSTGNIFGQCTNTSPYGSATAPTGGGSVTISTCNYASEYAPIYSVVAGATYIATSSVTTDFITVRQGTYNGAVIAYGTTPLTWTATVAGTYYIHYNTNSSCGTQGSCRTTTIINEVSSRLNTSQYPSSCVTAPINGNTTTISFAQWASKYNCITGALAGESYISSTSTSTDFITVRQGTYNGTIIASGQTPLTWVASISGNYYVHYNTNSSCGTENISRTSYIVHFLKVPASGNNSYTTCSGTIYDNGGSSGNYANSSSGYTTIYPGTPGNAIRLTGNYDTESGYDYLYIYNGVGIGGTLLFSGSGAGSIPILTSSDASGALTIRFTSDGSVAYSGFSLAISCVVPEMMVPSSGNNSYTVCSGNLYDSGGSTDNYVNYSNGYTVLYPTGSTSVVTISGTTAGEACCDYVRIYNGVGTGGTLLGTYNMGTSIPTLSSTDETGALTIYFYSDGSVVGAGINISISCSDRPDYLSKFISMDIGGTTWCAGETREVSVTIKNIGSNTWNTGYTTNVGVKWNADPDYLIRVTAGNLVPGATQTYYLNVTAPATIGNNNLTFDVVNEGNCWFANNSGSCGPGNSVYSSAQLTIQEQINVITGANQIMCSGANISLNSNTTNSFPNLTGTNSTSYSIPDNNATGVSSPITVSSSRNANEIISVSVNITHTWDGDLTLTLIAPNGSNIILSNRRGGSGDNFVSTVFQSTGTAIASGTAPFTGNFIPEAPFSGLTGTANGTWYLRAVDGAGSDVGTINNWTLTLSGSPAYSWTGPNGFTSSGRYPKNLTLSPCIPTMETYEKNI